MKDWKIICKKIIYPPLWLLTILISISTVVVTMSVYTIVRSTREIRKIKEQISHE